MPLEGLGRVFGTTAEAKLSRMYLSETEVKPIHKFIRHVSNQTDLHLFGVKISGWIFPRSTSVGICRRQSGSNPMRTIQSTNSTITAVDNSK